MKKLYCGASRAVLASCIVAGAAIVATPVFAQDEDTTTVSKVTIVGSLISGETETGVNNVNVFDTEDLSDQGAPNVVEFTRSLPQASVAFGEADIDLAATASGYVNVNLRGLGGTRTLTLFNGHRTDEDLSFLPMAAIGRVEVLNEGAGVTYGAGAVAGVINFNTRRNFHGAELSASQKFVAGSKGEQDYSALFGFGDEHANILLAAQYSEQHQLSFRERPYGHLPYTTNPASYTAYASNPGEFIIPSSAAGGFGSYVNDYTTQNCLDIGGYMGAHCYFFYPPQFNFVDYQSNLRVYASGDFDVTDTMHARFDFGYSRTDVPHVYESPTLPPTPTRRGAVGTLTYCTFTAYYCDYQVPIANTQWDGTENPADYGGDAAAARAADATTGVLNPFITEFYTRAGKTIPTAGGLPYGSAYTGLFYRPWAYGGFPDSTGAATKTDNRRSERYYASGELKGNFSEDGVFSFLDGITYDYMVSGGMTRTVLGRKDVIASRLQDALRGYGGPNCEAVDDTPTDYTSNATYDATAGIQDASIAPGTNGCEWFNPFASAWPTSNTNLADNPVYGGAAYENSAELSNWIQPYNPVETRNFDINIDAVFTGALPFMSLPGGDIGWALGGQYRATSFRYGYIGPDDLASLVNQECPYPEPNLQADYPVVPQAPGQLGCALEGPGPYWGAGVISPNFGNQQIKSLFGELRLPIFDNLEAQLAIRREMYSTLSANTYKASAKWQITDEWALRGSYSTNYAPPPAEATTSEIVSGTTYVPRFVAFLPYDRQNLPGLQPEQANVYNIGVIFQTDRFGEGSFFNATLDYFNYDIAGQIVTTSATTIMNSVAPSGTALDTALIDCSSGLISFVSLSGACVQGTTHASDITSIHLFQTNGPGQKAAGFDLGVNYFRGWGPGDFSAGANFTYNTQYQVGGYSVNGVVFDTDHDRLGLAAFSPAYFGSRIRGNVYAGYAVGRHNFRAQVNYTQGVTDAGGVPAAFPYSTYGIFPKDYIDLDLNYRFDVPWVDNTEFRLSVLNATNTLPMPAQVKNGYWSGVGNSRGRQIEVAITKKY